jgi:hypothetical protein
VVRGFPKEFGSFPEGYHGRLKDGRARASIVREVVKLAGPNVAKHSASHCLYLGCQLYRVIPHTLCIAHCKQERTEPIVPITP